VVEYLVVKFLQRKIIAFLRLVVVAQFQDLQFAQGIIEVSRIKRPAHRLGTCRFFFVVAIILEKLGRLFDRHFSGCAS